MQFQGWDASPIAFLPQGLPQRRKLQAPDLPDRASVVAVILAVADSQAIGVDPDDGRIIAASEVDTTACLDYSEGSALSSNAADPQKFEGVVVTQSDGAAGQQRQRRLQQATPASKATSGLLFALRAATMADPEVDVYNACADQTTVVMTKLNTIKLLVKVASIVSALPQDAITVVNGKLLPPAQDLSCLSPPCPYIEGAWNVFQVCVF
jgi:hypothetical protein